MVFRLALTRVVLVLMVVAGLGPIAPVRAQLDDEVRDRATTASVLLLWVPYVGGRPAPEYALAGSGTVISETGLILTNYHVVREVEHRARDIWVLTSNGRSDPRPAYTAEIVRANADLDLAVLQIVTDSEGNPVVPEDLGLPYVPIGDSDLLELGDDLYTLGYPGVGEGGLTYTSGVVSGFRQEPGFNGTAWILTDTEVSGGSSGGTTMNSAGELVGIPTKGLPLDCRPDDTNRDGTVNSADGCVPIGGSVAFLRPVNLAKPLIEDAQSQLEAEPSIGMGPVLMPPTHMPAPSSGDATTQEPSASVPVQPPSTLPAQPPLILSSLMPPALGLAPGQSFRLHEGGNETLAQVAAEFENPGMAQQLLSSLGWQEHAYRIFAADNPPPNAAGWVEIHVHRFSTVVGASEALPLLAWERQRLLDLSPLPLELFADQSTALIGPGYNGTEMTLFARRGSLVFRVTGIAPNGDPTNDVIETILMPLVPLATDPRVVTPELLMMLPGPEHVPPGLTQTEERARSASNTADTFANPDETRRLFQEWGWLESASGVYTGTTSNGTTRLEAVVYRWRDEAGASAALSYFVDSRMTALRLSEMQAPLVEDEARAITGAVDGGTEATVYMRSGEFLFRFTAIGTGDPMADVRYLLGAP